MLQRAVVCARGRFSSHLSSRADLRSYRAVNEPVLSFAKGSSERQQLQAALEKWDKVGATKIPLCIGDEEIHNDEQHLQVRPFDHSKAVASYSHATKEQLNHAIDVALAARHEWDMRPHHERADIMLKAADLTGGKYRYDIMAATMLGQGKTVMQAEIDAVPELVDFLRFGVDFLGRMLEYQPISTQTTKNSWHLRGTEGFWAAIAPFNFTAIGGHLALAPALMGNCVLLKPSDTAVLSNYVFYKILREAGVPAGIVNFVPADGPVFGDTVTARPELAGINFTGSVPTFRRLWRQVGEKIENYKTFPRLLGEAGGKNFHFVHPSADVNSVINGTILSAFEYGGQKCSACSRAYVPESLWGEVKEGLVKRMAQLKLGSPLEFNTFLSAVIDEKAFDRIHGYQQMAKSDPELEIIVGGGGDKSKGWFIEPTVVRSTNPTHRIMCEEIFGPLVSVYVYPDKDAESMLKVVDESTPYALTGAVFAQDAKFLALAQERLRHTTGNYYINDKSTGSIVGQQPFGGARLSGTNDKAGGPNYMLKFASPWTHKETFVPLESVTYPYMD